MVEDEYPAGLQTFKIHVGEKNYECRFLDDVGFGCLLLSHG